MQIQRPTQINAPHFTDVIRMTRAGILLMAGVGFLERLDLFTAAIGQSGVPVQGLMVAHAVVMAHIGGGVFQRFGFLTRPAALAQIPTLVGALWFVEFGGGFFTAASPIATATVLALTTLVVIFGGGRMSVDALLPSGHTALVTPREASRA